MSDWENNEDEHEVVMPSVPKKKWDDEESDNEDIPDEWDASEAEESEDDKAAKTAAAPTAAKPTKKKTPEERWAERQAERQAAKAEIKAAGGYDSESDDDGLSKRQRERQMELEAAASNVDDLFAGLTVKDTKIKDVLTALQPKTEAEFDELQTALVDRIQKSQNHRLYVQFLEKLIRELALPLKDIDVRKFSSTLTTLANEKQRIAREATKKKKPTTKKPTLVTAPKAKMDMNDYSNDYDDDDFM
ncbi:Translation initiation factor 3 subunit J component [Coemansia sp. BCRC 34301]|nr:Translation initiation factor 3 subunit J component [Coemansia sp. BCRC 34301]